MSHVFICYSSKDVNFARYLKSLLEMEGLAVWIDETEIASGTRWWPTIEQYIESCAAFVIIMSSHSKLSEWVEREILKAQKEKRPIYPVLLDGEPWDMLANRQHVNMVSGLASQLPQKFVAALKGDVHQRAKLLQQLNFNDRGIMTENSSTANTADNLVIGNLSIPVKLQVADSQSKFGMDDITVEYNPTRTDRIPQELADVMPGIISQSKEEAKRNGQVLFDGPGYFLWDYTLDITNPVTEEFRLNLIMGPSSYYRYIGSNRAIHLALLRSSNGMISLSEKYPLGAMDLSELPLSNYLAVNMNLITSDMQFLVQRRSRRVSNFQGSIASAINASMARGTTYKMKDEDKYGNPNPFITVMREANEELGIALSAEEISFFGLTVELEYYQTLLFGEVHTKLSSAEILRKAQLKAKDKFEYSKLEFTPFTLKNVAERLLDPSLLWVPVSALAVTFSAIHAFGEEELEQALENSGKLRQLGTKTQFS